MIKIAFFVEGQTERLFVQQLLLEIAGRDIQIETYRLMGGGKKLTRMRFQRTGTTPTNSQMYYALIYDCGSDSSVTSDVREQLLALEEAGYFAVVAIRDVYPLNVDQKPKLIDRFFRALPPSGLRPTLVLATMEVEAWFIAEHTHFQRVHHQLSRAKVLADLNIDIEGDAEARSRPAADLNSIYGLVGLTYSKSAADVSQVVAKINFQSVYDDLPVRTPSIAGLISTIDEFLNAAA